MTRLGIVLEKNWSIAKLREIDELDRHDLKYFLAYAPEIRTEFQGVETMPKHTLARMYIRSILPM